MLTPSSPLNSHDDFSPLREIVVGAAKNYTSHDREVSFEVFHHDNLKGFRSDWAYPRLTTPARYRPERSWKIKQRYAEELAEDVEGLAATLTAAGVRVHRPLDLPDGVAPIAGFGWQAPPVPPLNIRDNTLILADEIIETPPCIRSRYLETRLLAPVFRHYFQLGAGGRRCRGRCSPTPASTCPTAATPTPPSAGRPNRSPTRNPRLRRRPGDDAGRRPGAPAGP
ncbi:hypothetical protein ACFY4C_39305 [Actinomadura viridis]|uniref:hypothetical protein n=1 Tax=Actinomadura viridis TaxID=58110 RepID=UPI0036AC7ECF